MTTQRRHRHTTKLAAAALATLTIALLLAITPITAPHNTACGTLLAPRPNPTPAYQTPTLDTRLAATWLCQDARDDRRTLTVIALVAAAALLITGLALPRPAPQPDTPTAGGRPIF